jgi:putative hydrolase of the HAD superfamily
LSDLEKDLDCGRIAPAEFFRAAEASASLPRVSDDVWTPAWRDIFTPIPESIALLSRFLPHVSTCLVSNTNALHWEGVLRVADLDRRVDALALSFQVGASKPDARIFEAALEAAGTPRAEAVFADDRPDFVEAARSLGLDAFVVDSPATLEGELERRGVLGPPPPPELLAGLGELDAGRPFEAHEEWEKLWMRSSGAEKTFLQGLIQLAAACVHLSRGRRAPGLRLASLAREKLMRSPVRLLGVHAAPIIERLEREAAKLSESAPLSEERA